MRRIVLSTALLLAACAGGGADEDPTLSDTDGGETDRPDTDTPVDTDHTDLPSPRGCQLSAMSPAADAPSLPADGETFTFARTVEVCAGERLQGVWRVVTTNTAGEQLCAFQVSMAADTSTEGCAACDAAFSDVTYADAVFSNTAFCDQWGLDAGFVDRLNTDFDDIGTTNAPDLLFLGETDWQPVDASPEAIRIRTEHDDGVHVSVSLTVDLTW